MRDLTKTSLPRYLNSLEHMLSGEITSVHVGGIEHLRTRRFEFRLKPLLIQRHNSRVVSRRSQYLWGWRGDSRCAGVMDGEMVERVFVFCSDRGLAPMDHETSP